MATLEPSDLDVETLEYSTDNITLDATCGEEENPETKVPAKKKKKKKPKKSAKAKEEAALLALDIAERNLQALRPPVLQISRNKHWRYISSYHGPWLQLPVELLESLLVLNADPATLATQPEPRVAGKLPYSTHTPAIVGNGKSRDRSYNVPGDSPDPSMHSGFGSFMGNSPFSSFGKATPPPIDPGVFRSVTSIRRLIDEASELSVRATSGISNIPMGGTRGGNGVNNSPWYNGQNAGLGDHLGGGRNMALSAMRIHRLRVLAVQKLAEAYKMDEIASSVMVMQGGSVFDELAERVLRHDPSDPDARYVHFFHEKIPSRQLSESTTTQVLDELIAAFPQRLEYYRTRGMVHTFRDEYPEAIKDFTYTLKEARLARKARAAHKNNSKGPSSASGKRHKGSSSPDLENGSDDVTDGESAPLHPSALEGAPDPIEPQLLFMRGSAYLQHAVFLIETAILKLEGIRKRLAPDGSELRLSYLEGSRYGGVETGNPDGPLGKRDKPKRKAYKEALAAQKFKDQITGLVKKSIRDLEKFLSHFDTLEGPNPGFDGDLAHKTAYAFLLSESTRPGNHNHDLTLTDPPSIFSTYHPLIVECHFTLLLSHLMLMETHLPVLLPTFARTAALVDGLEGYPVFLPPRSVAHAEFVEILERLTSWRIGVQPHSLSPILNGRKAIQPAYSSSLYSSRSNGTAPSSSSRATIEMSSSGTTLPPPSPSSSFDDDPSTVHHAELVHGLDCLRMLLHPVLARQRKRAAEKASGANKLKRPPLSIPLHGPRVETILAWLAANALDEFESVA